MSQQKVDLRKAQKKNRKETLAREKRNRLLARIATYVVMIGVVGGVGYSFYDKLNPTPEADSSAFYSLIETDSYGILDPSLPE